MKKFRPKPQKIIFKLLTPVKEFLRDQPGPVKQELNGLIWKLEERRVFSRGQEEVDGGIEFRGGAGVPGLRRGIVAEEREEGRAAAADHDA